MIPAPLAKGEENLRGIYRFTFHHDELGMRLTRRAGGEERLLLVGDSMLYGPGVEDEETFASLIQESRQDIDIFNAGMPGRGVEFYKKVISVRVPEVKATRVIVFFFGGNDWQKEKEPQKKTGFESRLVQFVSSRLKSHKQGTELSKRDLPRVRSFLEEIKQERVPLSLVYLPSWVELDLRKSHHEEFQKMVNELGIVGLDLYPAFESTDFKALFIPGDGHFSALGHRFVADQLLKSISGIANVANL